MTIRVHKFQIDHLAKWKHSLDKTEIDNVEL